VRERERERERERSISPPISMFCIVVKCIF
jgi:hypothetical protein